MKLVALLFTIIYVASSVSAIAQPNSTIELKDKPKKYENRQLRAEKTGQKKLNVVGRAFQNTFTHYNYYFNANTRLNELIAAAKLVQKDDYNRLLSYYDYSLDATASQESEIDSIIYKITSGILLHDLRNDWIDDMYLLLGKAYLHRKQLDSAALTFQYINYAFAKKDDGYDIPIGSNSSNTNGVFTIATTEKKNIFKNPPTRNEALLWLSRSLIESDHAAESMGILQILKKDPNFPKRLEDQWSELMGFLNYKQKNYDSAAYFLLKSLPLADGNTEKGRKAFLAGQLYELAGQHVKAVDAFTRSAKMTNDPVMEVYANLYSIKATTNSGDEKLLQEKKDQLLKLAKKDKYESYRGIIYYVGARLELERKNYAAANELLKKSILYSQDPADRNAAFLLLGDINYGNRTYTTAYNNYDSLQIDNLAYDEDKDRVNGRKPSLKIVNTNYNIIHLEDSLQALARLTEEERNAILKKEIKKLRKEQGLKDEEPVKNNTSSFSDKAADLFVNAAPAKGEWYFNNTSLKGNGFTQFRQRWGTRPNVDNWRRIAAVGNAQVTDPLAIPNDGNPVVAKNVNPAISIEEAYKNLPFTQQQIDASNLQIENALLENGKTFQYEIRDMESAGTAYSDLLRRFPSSKNRAEVLYNLYQLNRGINNIRTADSISNILKRDFPAGLYTQMINSPQQLDAASQAATTAYKNVYDLFIEGRFTEALSEKQKADNIFGNRYWTPQLLYIESIYYVKEKQDSIAILRLQQLASNFKNSPLAERANTMIDVLKRRNEIENYLTNLEVERKLDAVTKPVDLSTPIVQEAPKKDLTIAAPINKTFEKKDSVVATAPAATVKTFVFNPLAPHYVVVVLDKVDPVFSSEAKNAFTRFNRATFANQNITVTSSKLDDRYQLVLMSGFKDAGEAVAYVERTKPLTNSRIVPWLAADKIKYSIIDADNLKLLMENKDLETYKKLMQQVLPGKF
jgi:hypothetical protein